MGLGWCPVMFSWLGSLYLSSGWPNWISSLKGNCPVVGFGGVYGFSISLGSPSDFCNVRHIYFRSLIKVTHSAYLHCSHSQSLGIFAQVLHIPGCLHSARPEATPGRGWWIFPVCSLTLPSSCGRPWACVGLPRPWSWPPRRGVSCACFSSPGPPSVLGACVFFPVPRARPLWGKVCVPEEVCMLCLSLSQARPLWNGVSVGFSWFPIPAIWPGP